MPYATAYADEGMLDTLKIYTQASKIALDGNGIITHRYGFGRGEFENWADLFEDIAAN